MHFQPMPIPAGQRRRRVPTLTAQRFSSPLFCAQHNGLILERAEEVIAVLEKAGAKGSPAPVVPVRTGPPSIARAAAGLLQSSVDSFFAKSNCGAWHHQPVAAMAVKAAREAGVG